MIGYYQEFISHRFLVFSQEYTESGLGEGINPVACYKRLKLIATSYTCVYMKQVLANQHFIGCI